MKIKDLKIGDKIWECESGLNVPLEVKTNPYKKNGKDCMTGWAVMVENFVSKTEFELYVADKHEYFIKIYKYPEYVGHHYINSHKTVSLNDVEKAGWLI